MRIDCHHCKAITDAPENAVAIFCPQSLAERVALGRLLGLTQDVPDPDPTAKKGALITVDAPLPVGAHVYELRGFALVEEEHTTRPPQEPVPVREERSP